MKNNLKKKRLYIKENKYKKNNKKSNYIKKAL